MISPALQNLIDEGMELKKSVLSCLSIWPLDPEGKQFDLSSTNPANQEAVRELMITVRRWVNSIAVSIPSGMPYEPSHLEADFNRIKSVLTGGYPSFAHAQEDIESVFNSPIDFIKSIPSPPVSMQPLASTPSSVLSSTFRPNTAFILMWMNLARPELQDVVNTFKGVFALFGIQTLRPDDIEHQDVLTEMVLQHIRSSEFLVADLTGERPNVYYEVGYAHAVGKRPILYRRKDTPLHFALSVHNVPEYIIITELKGLLQRRLEAITGKSLKEPR